LASVVFSPPFSISSIEGRVTPQAAHATCSSGFTVYSAAQLPDFTFTAGAPATVRFNPWSLSFVSTGFSCGILARSTTPGVSIQQTYACPGGGCPVWPTGEWAPVGDAYGTSETSVTQASW
jgi:hypothetical protein